MFDAGLETLPDGSVRNVIAIPGTVFDSTDYFTPRGDMTDVTTPFQLIIPFPPSGPTDIFGRMTADILSKTYSQQFIPDNRAGAGGNIGTEQCAKSPPDGYTICIATVSLSIAPALFSKLAFDPIKDFTHVTLIAKVPSLLTVHPAFPAKTVKDIIALAKARPGQLSYASTGNGTSPQMLMELFKSMTGTDIVHIPYRGQAPAVVDQIFRPSPTRF